MNFLIRVARALDDLIKILPAAILYAALGLGLVAATDTLHPPEPYHTIGLHLGGLFVVAGFASPVFEWRMKKELLRHMGEASRTFFTGDERLGGALYKVILERNIEGRRPYYRQNFLMDVCFSPLRADVPITDKITLPAAEYYEVVTTINFQAPLETARFAAGFSLSAGSEYLAPMFESGKFVFRDQSMLRADEYRLLSELPADSADLAAAMKKLFQVEIAVADQSPGRVESTAIAEPRPGLEIAYSFDRTPKLVLATGLVHHYIRARMYVSREVRRFPAILAYPCFNPIITFRGPVDSKDIFVDCLYSTYAPHRVRVQHMDTVRVVLSFSEESEGWTFPSSGVVFSW
jgi:hypothetical protein